MQLIFSKNQMRHGLKTLLLSWLAYLAVALTATLALPPSIRAQAALQQPSAKSAPAPAPKRDLSGVWQLQGDGSAQPLASDSARLFACPSHTKAAFHIRQ